MELSNYYFGRQEIKYIIPVTQGEAILEKLSCYLSYDPFMGTPEGYVVKSLYFDDNNFNDYFENVAGYARRKKLRLRTYVGFENTVFAEIKYKYGKTTNKWRKRIDKRLASQLTRGDRSSMLEVFSENLAMDILKKNYLPKLTVFYQRRAFRDKIGMGIRITLDTNIRSGPADLFSKDGYEPQHCDRILPPGYAILEFKVKNSLPFWLQKTVMQYSLKQTAYSKYIIGADRHFFRKSLIREDVEFG